MGEAEQEGLPAARLSLQAAAAMDFMQVDATQPQTETIARAATQLLQAEGEELHLIAGVLGRASFGQGVARLLARLPMGRLRVRALLLGEAVCAAASATGDGATLDLSGPNYWLTAADRSIATVASALRTEPSWLTSLNLRNSGLGEAGSVALAGALQSEHCHLTSLDLQSNGLREAGGIELAGVLPSEHCRLTSLNLAGNQLGEAAGVALAEGLQSEHCRLTSLNLQGCARRAIWFNGLREAGVVALAGALHSEHCRLTSLDISNNELGEAAGVALAGALQSQHCRLTSLNIEGTRIWGNTGLGEVAGVALAGALQSEHCRLTSLNLMGNGLSEATKAAIQQALPSARV